MHKKMMGLPAYVWVGAAVAGLLIGLYLRSRSGSSTTTVPTSTGGATTTVPTDNSTVDPGNLTGAVSGGGFAPPTQGLDPSTLSALLAGNASGDTPASGTPDLSAAVNNLANTLAGGLNIASSAGAGSSAAGKTAAPQTPKPAVKPPTVTKLKSGATLTTYASGKVVEKAPGKSAYVVKK
jgi:hypothetical protein